MSRHKSNAEATTITSVNTIIVAGLLAVVEDAPIVTMDIDRVIDQVTEEEIG